MTNNVFLLSAQILKDATAAKAEFGFLNTWLTMPAPPKGSYKLPLLWTLSKTQALVYERATHFASRAAPGFQTDWAWTGDQGLTIGSLIGQVIGITDPAERKRLIDLAVHILQGVQIRLVDGANNILNYWTVSGDVPDGDEGDYATGTGVFWRYMLRVRELDYLSNAFKTDDFQKILLTNAAEATKDNSQRTWPNEYQPSDDVTLANDLAVLVAASRMLKKPA